MSNVFPSPHPLVAHKLARLRSKDTEPRKFRELVREIAAR
jgi:uracil phosphoribosyltransferase